MIRLPRIWLPWLPRICTPRSLAMNAVTVRFTPMKLFWTMLPFEPPRMRTPVARLPAIRCVRAGSYASEYCLQSRSAVSSTSTASWGVDRVTNNDAAVCSCRMLPGQWCAWQTARESRLRRGTATPMRRE